MIPCAAKPLTDPRHSSGAPLARNRCSLYCRGTVEGTCTRQHQRSTGGCLADLQVARPHAWRARTPGAKVVVVVAVTVSLVGILVFAAVHEASRQTSVPLAQSRAAQAPVPTKQPLTRDEE